MPAYYTLQKDRVFARSWQFVPGAERVKAPGHVLPFTLLENGLDEPLVLVCGDDSVIRCLSNVCTHRGTLVVEGEGHVRGLRCRYPGRTLLRPARVFDGVQVHTGWTVLVHGDRIEAAGPAAQVGTPADTRITDLRGWRSSLG